MDSLYEKSFPSVTLDDRDGMFIDFTNPEMELIPVAVLDEMMDLEGLSDDERNAIKATDYYHFACHHEDHTGWKPWSEVSRRILTQLVNWGDSLLDIETLRNLPRYHGEFGENTTGGFLMVDYRTPEEIWELLGDEVNLMHVAVAQYVNYADKDHPYNEAIMQSLGEIPVAQFAAAVSRFPQFLRRDLYSIDTTAFFDVKYEVEKFDFDDACCWVFEISADSHLTPSSSGEFDDLSLDHLTQWRAKTGMSIVEWVEDLTSNGCLFDDVIPFMLSGTYDSSVIKKLIAADVDPSLATSLTGVNPS